MEIQAKLNRAAPNLSRRESQLTEQHFPSQKEIHNLVPSALLTVTFAGSGTGWEKDADSFFFFKHARVESLSTGLDVRSFEFESGCCRVNLGKSLGFSKTRFLYL